MVGPLEKRGWSCLDSQLGSVSLSVPEGVVRPVPPETLSETAHDDQYPVSSLNPSPDPSRD